MILAILAGPAVAQFEHKLFSSNLVFEAKAHYGFLYAQHLELEYYNAHFPAYEFIVQKLTYGRKAWERDYNFPLIGLSFFYSGAGNNPSLGSAYALMPFINFPLVKNEDFTAGFRFALGVGYITHPFDRLTNYRNLAIGSHLNAAVNLMAELRYRINYFLSITGGISLQHFSNGSLKLPNYGINLPLVNLGIACRPFSENQNIEERYLPPTEPYSAIIRRYIDMDIGGMLGYKNMMAVYGDNYVVSHFYGNAFVQLSRKSRFGIGVDCSYDPSQVKKLEVSGTEVTNKLTVVRPGINAAYRLGISQLAVILNLGCYLAGQEKSNGPLYEKVSLQYNFAEHFFASVMLKVHWGRADYIGWGLGYTIKFPYGKKTIK